MDIFFFADLIILQHRCNKYQNGGLGGNTPKRRKPTAFSGKGGKYERAQERIDRPYCILIKSISLHFRPGQYFLSSGVIFHEIFLFSPRPFSHPRSWSLHFLYNAEWGVNGHDSVCFSTCVLRVFFCASPRPPTVLGLISSAYYLLFTTFSSQSLCPRFVLQY